MYIADIHEDMPLVKEALTLFDKALSHAMNNKLKIFALVVGYGSTGGTSKIKSACITRLKNLKKDNSIKDFICGNEFDPFNKHYQELKTELKSLIPKEELKKRNDGMIYIFI